MPSDETEAEPPAAVVLLEGWLLLLLVVLVVVVVVPLPVTSVSDSDGIFVHCRAFFYREKKRIQVCECRIFVTWKN